jgi:stage III sporulation protein AA
MIRRLSNGIGTIKPSTIGLVDERSEIAAMYKGIPQNDIRIKNGCNE